MLSAQVTDSDRLDALEAKVDKLWKFFTALSLRLSEGTAAEEIIRRASAQQRPKD